MKRLTSRRIAVLFAGVLMAAIIFPGIAMSQAEEEAIIFPWYTSLTVGRIQFEGDEDLGVLKNKYDKGRAQVNVRQLKKNMTHIKDIMFTKIRSKSA